MLIGGAAAWPVAARAQDPGKKWLVGFISHGYERMYDALFDGLRELGYVEGQNITIERRYAEGRAERFKDFAREMVARKADLIIVTTTRRPWLPRTPRPQFPSLSRTRSTQSGPDLSPA